MHKKDQAALNKQVRGKQSTILANRKDELLPYISPHLYQQVQMGYPNHKLGSTESSEASKPYSIHQSSVYPLHSTLREPLLQSSSPRPMSHELK